MQARYAIFYAPTRESRLNRLAEGWLGRSAWRGSEARQIPLPGLEPGRQSEITAEPRRYGFHGTLKPPFALAPGASETDVMSSLSRLAGEERAFTIPKLVLSELGQFLALVPSMPDGTLNALAEKCVQLFDVFRAPLTDADLARHRASRLTARQETLLKVWGYPYVLDEFRFHLTLTGKIDDEMERQTVSACLKTLMEPAIQAPLCIEAVALFRQPSRTEPFQVIGRYPFMG